MRVFVPVLSLLVMAGSGARLYVSKLDLTACRYFLCDERSVVYATYTEQSKSNHPKSASFIRIYSDLLVRDPAEPMRWADLGWVLSGSDQAKARYCFDRAAAMGRSSADVQMYAGEFYLEQGDRKRSLACFSRILRVTRSFDEAIFSRYEARGTPVKDVLDGGVPDELEAAHAYLRYVMRPDTVKDAAEVWRWMTARGLGDLRVTAEYAGFLVRQSRFAEGAAAWRAGVGETSSGYGSREFVYDGGFEREPVGSPFDWTIGTTEHVEAARDGEPHSGGRSLRISFDGEANTDYHGVSQKTAVRPGAYQFRAFVKTDGITTDEGVRWQIMDAASPARLSLETEEMKGTRGWLEVRVGFVVGPATELLEMRLGRRASLRFGNKIKGTVWVDDVSLERAGR